jgi:hypothetical protein
MFTKRNRGHRNKVVRDLIGMNEGDDTEFDGDTTQNTPLLTAKEMHESKSTNMLEQDLLSKVDELVTQQEKEEKIDEISAKLKLSQTMNQPELFGDLTNEDIDSMYVKSPPLRQTVPPIPASLKDAKLQGSSKQPPPPPTILTNVSNKYKAPPPIPTHLKKTNFDIEYEINGIERSVTHHSFKLTV